MHLTDNEAAQRVADNDNLVGELVEALQGLLGWFPGQAHWHTDAPMKAAERARAALFKAGVLS